jgi:hypothetical protein
MQPGGDEVARLMRPEHRQHRHHIEEAAAPVFRHLQAELIVEAEDVRLPARYARRAADAEE